MRIDRPRRSKRLISLTPLIDVIFILLVFFMLASSYQEWHALTLDVPAGQAAPHAMEEAILIRLHANGGLNLNGVPLTLERLIAQLQPHVVRNPDQRILVQPEPTVQLQQIITVMDRLADVGGTNVALIRQ